MDKIKAKYPSIKEVKVTKIFPDTLAIDLIERKPIAKLVIQDKTMLVDQDGYLFTDNILKPDQFWEIRCPVVDIPENKLTDQTILHGLRVLANIPQTANIPIEHLDCVESNTYSVQLSETKVLISDKRPADEVAASLLFLVKQFRIDGRWPVLVDLRFAKPVLKMTDTDAIIATASGTE